MLPLSATTVAVCTSHPARGEWIEITDGIIFSSSTMSHPARGEWIEILIHFIVVLYGCVSPREG